MQGGRIELKDQRPASFPSGPACHGHKVAGTSGLSCLTADAPMGIPHHKGGSAILTTGRSARPAFE